MTNSRIAGLFVILAVSATLWGCPKNTQVTTAPEESKTSTPSSTAPTSEEKSSAKPESGQEAASPSNEASAASSSGLQPIYFDFDQAAIRADARNAMKANAEWLKAHPNALIRIEGNCDERGTKEYNQALGQRRAANAKKFLTDLGVSGKRLTLLSYGKEKPACSESSEDCLQKNRRDDFETTTE